MKLTKVGCNSPLFLDFTNSTNSRVSSSELMVDIDVVFSIVVTVLTGIATIMNAIASKLSQEAGDRASLIIEELSSASHSFAKEKNSSSDSA